MDIFSQSDLQCGTLVILSLPLPIVEHLGMPSSYGENKLMKEMLIQLRMKWMNLLRLESVMGRGGRRMTDKEV